MKEHGLLLSAPMVRALPRKTQTRRVITMHNSVIDRFPGRTKKEVWNALDFNRARVDHVGRLWVPFKPGETVLNLRIEVRPRIQAGDPIWWKECMRLVLQGDEKPPGYSRYLAYRATADTLRSTHLMPLPDALAEKWDEAEEKSTKPYGWRSSMLMPRWAARHTSTVVATRAERLVEISGTDAMAEGVATTEHWTPKEVEGRPFEEKWWDDFEFFNRYPPMAYRKLWESINGPGSWDANPLVWVVQFSPTSPDPK